MNLAKVAIFIDLLTWIKGQLTSEGCKQIFIPGSLTRSFPLQASYDFNENGQTCLTKCKARGYNFAGWCAFGRLQFTYCFCGVALADATNATSSTTDCFYKCPSNTNQNCGGWTSMNVYSDSALAQTNVTSVGCFNRNAGPSYVALFFNEPPQICLALCNRYGYTHAGIESILCFCGNAANFPTTSNATGSCTYLCVDGTSCGGPGVVNVYSNPSFTPTTLADGGCYSFNIFSPMFAVTTGIQLTPDLCISDCNDRGFQYAGIRSGSICMCGSLADINAANASLVTAANNCNLQCTYTRSDGLTCGGFSAISIYNNTGYNSSAIITMNDGGCMQDNIFTRQFPVLSSISAIQTPESCLRECRTKNYPFAGLASTALCYCGTAAQNTARTNSTTCTTLCTGKTAADTYKYCGGTNSATSVYF